MSMTFATKVIKTKGENKLITGTGTAGTGGSASVAYVPSLWTFNIGMTPVAGDMITIKIPVAGNASGVWMSVDNGTTYYPVATISTSRFTTHYPIGEIITLAFETGMQTGLYGNTKAGGAAGAALTNYSLDRWVVVNYYDSNTTYSTMSTAEVTAGTASSSRVMQARYLSAGLKAAIIKGTNTVPGQFTVYGTAVDTLGATSSDNGKILTVSNGTPSWQDPASGLPAVTSSDNGKFLRVVNGAWAAETIPNASGVSF